MAQEIATSSTKATQQFVPIQEVRDGIVVLKDGTLLSILLASSVNFSLKSADEQQAIILQFQNMLNSLEFSIQIFVQSRKLDIRPYIALLEGRYKEQTEDLLKIQTREYVQFIKNFTDNSNIMSKSFFVVIPYAPPIIKNKASIFSFFGMGDKSPLKPAADFEEERTQLEQRVGIVTQGLASTGIRVAELGTEEVIELFYKLFNPGELEKPIQLERAGQSGV